MYMTPQTRISVWNKIHQTHARSGFTALGLALVSHHSSRYSRLTADVLYREQFRFNRGTKHHHVRLVRCNNNNSAPAAKCKSNSFPFAVTADCHGMFAKLPWTSMAVPAANIRRLVFLKHRPSDREPIVARGPLSRNYFSFSNSDRKIHSKMSFLTKKRPR